MDNKEKTKVEKKEKVKKPSKQVLLFTGIFLVTLGNFFLIFFAGYLGVTYSPLIREYAVGLSEQETEVPSDERKFVVTEAELNVVGIVEEVSHSVVSIAVSRLTLSPEQGLIDQSTNIGTGFVVDSSGLIVTNQHVVSDLSADYMVMAEDGTEYKIIEILRDDLNDIALIKIDLQGGQLDALELGDSDTLLVGQSVIAIGTPLGQFAGSVTTGIISGLNRSVTASSGWFGSTARTYDDVIQTDAAINPGNSGGPLINSQGKVIGISFATTSGADNISFAIPVNRVKTRLEEYRTYGKFIRPFLGVTYQMISQYEAMYYSDVVPGALILRVDSTSPAYEGDLRRGDIIVKFGEFDVDKSLAEIIQEHSVGEEIEIVVLREGQEEEVRVTLGEMD